MGQLTFGSLFSGIGGLDLGMERAGFVCRWQSEIDDYASRVLKKHWPHIPNLGDVKQIDWNTVEPVDVIVGGYPCQPFSVAGSRNGGTDERHLWPWFANAISVVRPRYALLENVAGHLSLGFGQVLGDLAKIRYDARWDCIPAAAVGAPHRRDRVFLIARDTRSEQRRSVANSNNTRRHNTLFTRWNAPWHGSETVANANSAGREEQHVATVTVEQGHNPRRTAERRSHWEVEPSVGRMADGIPNRLDRLRGLGNAVVPQVAEHVARIIMQDAT
jgi:DNA (cytosine-5)-methyltransferase 1